MTAGPTKGREPCVHALSKHQIAPHVRAAIFRGSPSLTLTATTDLMTSNVSRQVKRGRPAHTSANPAPWVGLVQAVDPNEESSVGAAPPPNLCTIIRNVSTSRFYTFAPWGSTYIIIFLDRDTALFILLIAICSIFLQPWRCDGKDRVLLLPPMSSDVSEMPDLLLDDPGQERNFCPALPRGLHQTQGRVGSRVIRRNTGLETVTTSPSDPSSIQPLLVQGKELNCTKRETHAGTQRACYTNGSPETYANNISDRMSRRDRIQQLMLRQCWDQLSPGSRLPTPGDVAVLKLPQGHASATYRLSKVDYVLRDPEAGCVSSVAISLHPKEASIFSTYPVPPDSMTKMHVSPRKLAVLLPVEEQ